MPLTLIQLLLFVSVASALVATMRRARARAISRTEAISWGALWIAAGVVVLRPDITSRFAAFVGVGRGADAVVYAAVVALFYLVFRIYIRIDKLERDITAVVRKDALASRQPRKE